MPTDEQLREREKELRRQVREPWLAFSEKHRESLSTNELFFLREGYEAAWIQRDLEVQALRELVSRAERLLRNAEVRAGYCACGDGPDEHSQDHSYLDMGEQMTEQWLKGAAALRGEEGASHE